MTINTIMRQELIRPRSRGVIQTISSCSTESDSSYSSTVSRLAHEAQKCPTQPRRRRVTFCEKAIEYQPEPGHCKDDCYDCWYSTEDIRSFKAQTGDLARKILRKPTQAQQEWIHNLITAYTQLVQAKTAEDIHSILDGGSHIEFDPRLLGMEKWILRPVVQDKTTRRKCLYGFVQACKRDVMSSQSRQIKELRKASRELSCPSRLFAHHVAFAVSSSGEN